MKKVLLAVVVLASLAGCTTHVREADFRKMSAFAGEVVEFEQIPWHEDFVPWSGAGPHYRVTIKQDDGDLIIMDRWITDITWGIPGKEGMLGLKGEFPRALYDHVSQKMMKAAFPFIPPPPTAPHDPTTSATDHPSGTPR